MLSDTKVLKQHRYQDPEDWAWSAKNARIRGKLAKEIVRG